MKLLKEKRMSRLFAWFTLGLLLVVTAQPASGMIGGSSENRVWDFFDAAANAARNDDAGTLENAGRASRCDYELASGLRKWPSEDPIGESGGLNLYGYVGNGPTGATDPLGLNPAVLIPIIMIWFATEDYANAPKEGDRTQGGGTGAAPAIISGVTAGAGNLMLSGLSKVGVIGLNRLRPGSCPNLGPNAGKIALQEGETFIAVVKDGKIIAQGSPALSHFELVKRQLGGVLPEGAEAVTIGKSNGVIGVLTSMTYAGKQVLASDAIQAVAKALYK